MAAVVLTSIQAGVGKTTLTAGIAASLRAQGCTVASFCVGPGLAQQPPGPSCIGSLPQQPLGLDGWLLTCDAARAAFHSAASAADVALIEGCLGLFDSPAGVSAAAAAAASGGGSEQGSTAQMAAWLHVPLVLVIDGQAFSTPRSIVALVRGYADADSGSSAVAGIILNKAARQGLAAEAQAALNQAGLDVAVLGAVPKLADLEHPRQQPGSAWSGTACSISLQGWVSSSKLEQQLAQQLAQHLDLSQLRRLAATAAVPQPCAPLPPAARTFRVSMGVACDQAFYRYFQQNLHMLQLAGVALVPFSPLHDGQLPPGLSAVLLGGGAVAEHAQQLAANSPMLQALRAFAKAGGLVVGEADGLLYLSQSLQLQLQQGQAGQQQQQHLPLQRHAMAGLLPLHTQAQLHRSAASHTYVAVTVTQTAPHPLLLPGSSLRGLATCSCQVVEERPVGGLTAALAAAAGAAAPAEQALLLDDAEPRKGGNSSGGGSSSSSLDVPTTPPSFGGGSRSSNSSTEPATGYTYSFTCTPLPTADHSEAAAPAGAAAAAAAAAGAAGIEEGYTCGTVLATAVQLHYGTCPGIVAHMAQRCLRVDVASATAAASEAAAAAAAAAAVATAAAAGVAGGLASTAGQRPLSLNVELPDSPSVAACAPPHEQLPLAAAAGDPLRLPSPGSRSAPNLQQMLWLQGQDPARSGSGSGSARSAALPPPPAAAAAAALGGSDGRSSSGLGQTWFSAGSPECGGAAPGAGAQLSPAKKSASVPSGMWQLGSSDVQLCQQQQQQQQYHQQYQHYQRHQYQQQLRMQHFQQQPFGFRGASCPTPGLPGQPGTSASDNGTPAAAAPGPGRWAPPSFSVPKRWSLELQKLGSSLTSQLLPGANGGGRPESPHHAGGGSGSGQAPPRSSAGSRGQHSRSNSRGMMHLPEETPLSADAIKLLDTSLPCLLGRTHHTHIGLAVPLSSGASSAAASSSGSVGGPSLGGSSMAAAAAAEGGGGSMSHSSSVHEQMSNLAASLAQQEASAAAAAAAGVGAGGQGPGAGSVRGHPLRPSSDLGSVGTHYTDIADASSLYAMAAAQPPPPLPPPQQQQQQLEGGAGQVLPAAMEPGSSRQPRDSRHRMSLDQLALYSLQQQQAEAAGLHTTRSAGGLSRLSLDAQSAFAAPGAAPSSTADSCSSSSSQTAQPPSGGDGTHASALLQQELSFRVGLGSSLQQQQQPGSHGSLAELAGGLAPAALPSSKSNSKLSMWQAAATPTAAATAAAAAGAAAAFGPYPAGGRIISLSPAATDCLIALGLCSSLAGVTDACRLAAHSRGAISHGSGGGGGCRGCGQLLQLLEGIEAPWAAEAVEDVAAASSGEGGAAPAVVCRLVEGPDGLPRYKLDEDTIRETQPTLVAVACEENSGDEQHLQHYAQLRSNAPPPRTTPGGSAAAAATAAAASATAALHPAGGSSSSSSSSVNGAVAVPGRVRLEAAVVQRVLQRAGVWGEGRALVLYQACHSLAEVLEFMQVLAQAAGVPERGVLLARGLRARMRDTAATVARCCCSSSGSDRGLPPGPSVAVVDVVSGPCLRLAGFWVPEMLHLAGAGALPAAPGPGQAPADISWAGLRAAAPAVLVVALPGLGAADAAAHIADLAALPGFWGLPAARAGAVYAVDHALLTRPGPCLVLGLGLLAHLVAPGAQPLPPWLPPGSVLKLGLHGGQRCRPRLVPHFMCRYC